MAGKPQTLSSGQKKEVVTILRKQVAAGVLVGFAILSGVTGLSLWGIARRVEQNMESLVAEQFKEPQIQTVVRDVAAGQANAMMLEQIQPEVKRFTAEVDEQLGTIQSTLAKVAELAAPPVLTLTGRDISRSDSGITVTFQFTPSKNVPLGRITFNASIVGNSNATITDFWPTPKHGSFSSGPGSKNISPDGRNATLVYSLISPGKPTIDLTVTAACEAVIESNYLTTPLTGRIE